MKIAKNNKQEEYKAFLKNIREEREETSNFAKLLFTIVLAILCAVVVCDCNDESVVRGNIIPRNFLPFHTRCARCQSHCREHGEGHAGGGEDCPTGSRPMKSEILFF